MSDEHPADQLQFGAWSSPDEKALVRDLAAIDPGLGALLAEHLREHDEVLSMLYLNDVVRWANEQFLAGDRAAVSRLLTVLEDRFEHGDRYVRDLIAVGFVEGMDASHRAGMARLLGPMLIEEYNQQNGYTAT
jgi:hypothetical protein